MGVIEEKEAGISVNGKHRLALAALLAVLVLGLLWWLLDPGGHPDGGKGPGQEGPEVISGASPDGQPSADGSGSGAETGSPTGEETPFLAGGGAASPPADVETDEPGDEAREVDELLGVPGSGDRGSESHALETPSPGAPSAGSRSPAISRLAADADAHGHPPSNARRGSSGRPTLSPQERREREEKRRRIKRGWDGLYDTMDFHLDGWADRGAWSEKAREAAEEALKEHIDERREATDEAILLEMDEEALQATFDAVRAGAGARGRSQGQREADSRGIVWNSWVEDPFAPLAGAVAPEEIAPDRRYTLRVDLAPMAYRVLVDWPEVEASTPDGRLLDALEKARDRRVLELDVRPWAIGRTVRLVSPRTQRVVIDLERLFAENSRLGELRRRAEPPSLEEVSEALRSARIEIPFETEGHGCGAVALSITQADRFRPLDHLVRQIPVQKPGGEALKCGPESLKAESFAAGLRSALLHRAAPRVDGALHLFEIEDGSRKNTIVYWINGKQDGEYFAWNAGGDLQRLLADSARLAKMVAEIEAEAEDKTDFEKLKDTDDGGRRLASPDYTPLANMIADLLFTGKSEEDRSQAQAARADLTRLVEENEGPATLIVRKVNLHHEVELAPFQLLDAPGQDRLFARPVHLIFPLEREDYTSEPACIEDFTIAVPPVLDGENKDFKTPVESLLATRRWLHVEGKSSMKTLKGYLLGRELEGDEKGAERPKLGEALVLAAHHDKGSLWYSEKDPLAERYFNNHAAIRTFGRGSLAVLAICTASSPRPEDSSLAHALNSKEVETLILSPFPVNVDYGKAFAIHFGLAVENARRERRTPTVMELFDKAAEGADPLLREALYQEWSAGRHIFLVAGNHELRLCPPKEDS